MTALAAPPNAPGKGRMPQDPPGRRTRRVGKGARAAR